MIDSIVNFLSDEFFYLTNPGGNVTVTSFSTRPPTTTPPSQVTTGVTNTGDGVISMGDGGMNCASSLLLVPYGTGAATNTMNMKILGWRATNLTGGQKPRLWVPITLGVYAVTLGTTPVGVAGSDLGTTSIFNDTITMTGGPTFVTSGAAPVTPDWFQISAGAAGGAPDIGMISVRSFGFRFLEVLFNTNSSVSGCNALWCRG